MSVHETHDTRDEIILEVRRIKEELARREEFDVRRIVAEARKKQAASGHQVIAAPAREKA